MHAHCIVCKIVHMIRIVEKKLSINQSINQPIKVNQSINQTYHFILLLIEANIFQDGYIEFGEFLQALSVTSRGSVQEKLQCKNYVYNYCLP